MLVTIIILSILSAVSIYINFNLFRKLERYEDTFEETDKFIQDEIKISFFVNIKALSTDYSERCCLVICIHIHIKKLQKWLLWS